MRFFITRLGLRAAYLLLACLAGFLGVFYVGVQAVGDNPGAVAVLPPMFAAVYVGCLLAELVISQVRWRQGWACAAGFLAGEIAILVAAALAALACLYLGLPKGNEDFPFWLRYELPLAFLGVDSVLAYFFYSRWPRFCSFAR